MKVTKSPSYNQEKLEQLKALKQSIDTFSEQERLYKRMEAAKYEGDIHPGLWDVFSKCRKYGNAERMGGAENFIKFMSIDSFEGLSFVEIGNMFNFIEGLQVNEVINAGVEEAVFMDIFAHTYRNSAMRDWNGQQTKWKEEIALEKSELISQYNAVAEELNPSIKKQSKKVASLPAPVEAN